MSEKKSPEPQASGDRAKSDNGFPTLCSGCRDQTQHLDSNWQPLGAVIARIIARVAPGGPVVRSADLAREYLGQMRRMTLDDARGLLAAGIPIEAIAAVCPAPARIRLTGRRYEPDPAGGPAYVFPATTAEPGQPYLLEDDDPAWIIAAGPVVDLVAVSPFGPNRWALRTGTAMALGAIEPQTGLFSAPVPIHRDVLSWLRFGCSGIVLLTQDPHERGQILRQITTPQCEDAEHAAEIDHLMTLAYPRRSIATVRHA